MIYLTALAVGFLGSFHCIGMCGPIALALPVRHDSKFTLLLSRLTYNTGRILTYIILGLLVGAVGHTLAIAGFQKNLSIVSGILILVVAIASIALPRLRMLNSAIMFHSTGIRNIFKKLFSKKTFSSLFLIGSVNGLLPCGFVYLALMASASTGNIFSSMGYMACFGFGTIPVMLSISLAGSFFGIRFHKFFRRATPFVASALAIFLIMRGVNMHNGCHHH
jgi:sulfite exporter TauE/SafE